MYVAHVISEMALSIFLTFTLLQPFDDELFRMYGDTGAKRKDTYEITLHASLAMALSSVEEEQQDESALQYEKLVAGRGLKRAFVAHTAVPSQKEVR